MNNDLKRFFLTTSQNQGENFKIQRGTTDFGASADTKAVTITTVRSTTSAFVRITGTTFNSGGVAAGSDVIKFQDDVGMSVVLTDTSTITFTRYTNGENVNYRVEWEVWEYVGPSGGEHEFIVRHNSEITMANTVGQLDTAVEGISTLGNCIPFVTGLRHNSGTGVKYDRVFCSATMINDGDNKIRLNRGDPGEETIVSIAVVEFTGTSWSIQNNITHTQSATGDQTETITDISNWNNAFIEGTMRNAAGGTNKSTYIIRPGSTTTTVRFWILSLNTGTDQIFVAHVAKNTSLSIEHLDSITGGATNLPAGSSSPQTVNETISAVDSLEKTAVIAYARVAGVDAIPKAHWLYSLSSTTNLRWWRGKYTDTAEWSAQIIQLP